MPNNEIFRLRHRVSMTADSTAEVMLFGEIISDIPEDWKWSKQDKSAADFDRDIKNVRAKGATKLKLRVHSPGGIVDEAMAMRATLAEAGFDEINIYLEGICASAATLLPTIHGSRVYIYEGTEFMIHNPRAYARGTAADMRRCAEMLEVTEKNVRGIYAKRTGQDDDQLKEWMEAETWFSPEDAVKYGFADEVVEASMSNMSPAVACVTREDMEAMKRMYRNTPEMKVEQIGPGTRDNVSSTPNEAGVTEIHNNEEEETEMEIQNATMEQLREQNPELYQQIMSAGFAEERQRIQDIDDLTPPGADYAQMAQDAKTKGMSAMDYHKQIVAAQRKKGDQFMSARQAETGAAAAVPGSTAGMETGKNEDELINEHAKSVAEYAKSLRAEMNGSMF